MLIDTMSSETFEPEKFTDEYREAVMAMIDARVAGESVAAPEAKKPAATNVVNLMDVLQRSLEQTRARTTAPAKHAKPAAAKAVKKSAAAAKPKRKKTAA
jgi:DNA end-binding protein Ku